MTFDELRKMIQVACASDDELIVNRDVLMSCHMHYAPGKGLQPFLDMCLSLRQEDGISYVREPATGAVRFFPIKAAR